MEVVALRKRNLAFLFVPVLIFCLLCGCADDDPNADDPLAAYNGTWYFAKNGVACEFGEGNIYRDDKNSSAGQTLTGIYSGAGDHLEANLAGVGGVDQLRKLYIVDGDQGQVLCDSADGKGTVYFYRDPLAALTALEEAEAMSSAVSTPIDEAPPSETPGTESPAVVPLEPLDDPGATSSPSGSKTIPSDPEPQPAAQTEKTSGVVWVSQSGSKYHSSPSCSGMKNPSQLSLSEAQSQGYTPCKRCH